MNSLRQEKNIKRGAGLHLTIKPILLLLLLLTTPLTYNKLNYITVYNTLAK